MVLWFYIWLILSKDFKISDSYKEKKNDQLWKIIATKELLKPYRLIRNVI